MSVSCGKSLEIVTVFAARQKEQTERLAVLLAFISLDKRVLWRDREIHSHSAGADIQECRNCGWTSQSFPPKIAIPKTKSNSLRDREAIGARLGYSGGFTAPGPTFQIIVGIEENWGAEIQSVKSLRT